MKNSPKKPSKQLQLFPLYYVSSRALGYFTTNCIMLGKIAYSKMKLINGSLKKLTEFFFDEMRKVKQNSYRDL